MATDSGAASAAMITASSFHFGDLPEELRHKILSKAITYPGCRHCPAEAIVDHEPAITIALASASIYDDIKSIVNSITDRYSERLHDLSYSACDRCEDSSEDCQFHRKYLSRADYSITMFRLDDLMSSRDGFTYGQVHRCLIHAKSRVAERKGAYDSIAMSDVARFKELVGRRRYLRHELTIAERELIDLRKTLFSRDPTLEDLDVLLEPCHASRRAQPLIGSARKSMIEAELTAGKSRSEESQLQLPIDAVLEDPPTVVTNISDGNKEDVGSLHKPEPLRARSPFDTSSTGTSKTQMPAVSALNAPNCCPAQMQILNRQSRLYAKGGNEILQDDLNIPEQRHLLPNRLPALPEIAESKHRQEHKPQSDRYEPHSKRQLMQEHNDPCFMYFAASYDELFADIVFAVVFYVSLPIAFIRVPVLLRLVTGTS